MASSAATAAAGRPMSIEELTLLANNYEYNDHIPLRYWLRSADTIQKEAQIYEREGNEQQTYLLLLRHAMLVLEKLSKHPEAKDQKNKPSLAEAQKFVKRDLAKLEVLKPHIQKQYSNFILKEREARAKRTIARSDVGSLVDGMSKIALHSRQGSDTAVYDSKQALEPGENAELAARLAKKEIKRRNSARRAVRQAGISEEQEHERRTGGLWGNWERELVHDTGSNEVDALSQSIRDVGRRQQEAFLRRNPAPVAHGSTSSTTPYHYPDVKKSAYTAPSLYEKPSNLDAAHKADASRRSAPPLPPRPPAKEPKDLSSPPPIPSKVADDAFPKPRSRSASAAQTDPELDTKKYWFNPTAKLENGKLLRSIFLPKTLRTTFLEVAAENTRNNLETCGILCGTLLCNALFISKLVIPEQVSTSDTCETSNEGALFDYCDSEDLMVLGWIHTHPSQTCFMSSRDLHTHCGYQVMLPESIAIVCAPSKNPSWGVFRLTDPPGMQAILNCHQEGLFHPHGETHTYTDALRPGHVYEAPLEFELVDLRPKKR